MGTIYSDTVSSLVSGLTLIAVVLFLLIFFCAEIHTRQLSWNVMIESESAVNDDDIDSAFEELLHQSSALFTEQISSLTSFQMNFLKAVADGVDSGFTSEAVLSKYSLGTKSNVSRIIKALVDKELIEVEGKIIRIADPVFLQWFIRGCIK